MDNSTYNELMKMIKIFTSSKIKQPEIGNQVTYNLIEKELEDERFKITINRKCHIREDNLIYLLNSKRYNLVIRLDMLGPAHDNNDGTSIDTPHLHIYNEKYREGKIAVPLSELVNKPIELELYDSLVFFLKHCNVDLYGIELPMI